MRKPASFYFFKRNPLSRRIDMNCGGDWQVTIIQEETIRRLRNRYPYYGKKKLKADRWWLSALDLVLGI